MIFVSQRIFLIAFFLKQISYLILMNLADESR